MEGMFTSRTPTEVDYRRNFDFDHKIAELILFPS